MTPEGRDITKVPKLERVTMPRVSYLSPLLPVFTFYWSPDGEHDVLNQVWHLEMYDYNQWICLVNIAKLTNLNLEPCPSEFLASKHSLPY